MMVKCIYDMQRCTDFNIEDWILDIGYSDQRLMWKEWKANKFATSLLTAPDSPKTLAQPTAQPTVSIGLKLVISYVWYV